MTKSCEYKACNAGECPCGDCHGAGYVLEPDPSGETEEVFGVTYPKFLERYCTCDHGASLHFRHDLGRFPS